MPLFQGLFAFPNFNSIKVRLEPFALMLLKQITQFQFHKGTIRT